jgi:hypothetical protein
MKAEEPHFRYAATVGEAREPVDQFDRFWVSNCGCREGGDG